MLVLQILRLSEFLILYDVQWGDVGVLMASMCLSFQPLVIPTSVVFAAFSVFGRFVSQKEWLGLLSSGIGWRKVLPTMLVFFGIPVSLFCLWVGLEVVPWGSRQAELVREDMFNRKSAASIKTGEFLQLMEHMLFYVDSLDPETQTLYNLFIFDERQPNIPMTITGQKGHLSRSLTQKTMILNVEQGLIHSLPEEDASLRVIKFEDLSIRFELDNKFVIIGAAPASFRLSDLKTELDKLRKENNRTGFTEFALDFHRRFALPFSVFVFVLLAFALSITTQHRTLRIPPLIQSLLLLTIMWLMYISGSSMVFNGWVSPVLALWFPNALFLSVAIVHLTQKINLS
jgi:lipopolysaccharide export system permease protein